MGRPPSSGSEPIRDGAGSRTVDWERATSAANFGSPFRGLWRAGRRGCADLGLEEAVGARGWAPPLPSPKLRGGREGRKTVAESLLFPARPGKERCVMRWQPVHGGK